MITYTYNVKDACLCTQVSVKKMQTYCQSLYIIANLSVISDTLAPNTNNIIITTHLGPGRAGRKGDSSQLPAANHSLYRQFTPTRYPCTSITPTSRARSPLLCTGRPQPGWLYTPLIDSGGERQVAVFT